MHCRVPSVTAFLAAFQDSKQIYIVMEHCAGGDLLEQLLKEGRAMTEQRVALEIALPILTALSHIHQLRIIHRCPLILHTLHNTCTPGCCCRHQEGMFCKHDMALMVKVHCPAAPCKTLVNTVWTVPGICQELANNPIRSQFIRHCCLPDVVFTSQSPWLQ